MCQAQDESALEAENKFRGLIALIYQNCINCCRNILGKISQCLPWHGGVEEEVRPAFSLSFLEIEERPAPE